MRHAEACGKSQMLALRLPARRWEHNLGTRREPRVRTWWVGWALLFQAFGCWGARREGFRLHTLCTGYLTAELRGDLYLYEL